MTTHMHHVNGRVRSVPMDAVAPLPDVQERPDRRGIAIDRVGVSGVAHPLRVRGPDGRSREVAAQLALSVSLAADRKGTHMSRFLEVLGRHADLASPRDLASVAAAVRERLGAERAFITATFPWFVEKRAPVTGAVGFAAVDVRIDAESIAGRPATARLTVAAGATSLCPCSKEISIHGAHNQRCRVEAEVALDGDLGIEDLLAHAEAAASMRTYPVLKRPDEKHVTEKAYENPKFVEDIVRDLAGRLDGDDRVLAYRVRSTNFESIHDHDAFAEIARTKSPSPSRTGEAAGTIRE